MNVADGFRIAAGLVSAMRSQWWAAGRIREHQEIAMARILRHAAARVPFYRRLGIPADAIRGVEDLGRFPVIGKRDVQVRPEDFIAEGFDAAELRSSRTSGSSGRPTTTWFDRDAWLLGKYVYKMRRVAATCGNPLMRRVLIVSEQPPESLPRASDGPPGLGLLVRLRFLSIHTDPREHLDEIARFRPDLIYAFPSYLLDLVSSAAQGGVRLPKVDVLYTSSEVLTPAARTRIEAAFSGKVYDVYGSTEFKEVAWQCRDGRYHLNFETVYVEPQAPGPPGPVILTTLCNFAMPLIRFDIGDRAEFGDGDCPCGRRSPHMTGFAGREGDMIVLPDGRWLSPYLLTTIVECEESILQYRIVQEGPDAFRVDAVVRVPGQSAAWRDAMCAALARKTGGGAKFTVREADRLERSPGGKRSVFARQAGAPAGGEP